LRSSSPCPIARAPEARYWAKHVTDRGAGGWRDGTRHVGPPRARWRPGSRHKNQSRPDRVP
jgi:hypothetical protein